MAAVVAVSLGRAVQPKELAAQAVAAMVELGRPALVRVFKVVRQGLPTQAAVAVLVTQAVQASSSSATLVRSAAQAVLLHLPTATLITPLPQVVHTPHN